MPVKKDTLPEQKKPAKKPAKKKKPPAKKKDPTKPKRDKPIIDKLSEKQEEPRGRGQPRSFANGDVFEARMNEYITYCNNQDRLANVAGFCVYCGITKDTFYQQQVYYSDSFKKCNDMLEDAAVNHKVVGMGIFYLKNKFGYKDKLETENVNLNVNTETEMDKEQADSILKQFGIEFNNINTKQK